MRRKLTGLVGSATPTPTFPESGYSTISTPCIGSGEARFGEARVAVRPGDWIALRPGPTHAHQMVNSSVAEPLVYLCVHAALR
jgi:hypothetical protein